MMEIAQPGDLRDIADLGLSWAEAKQVLAAIQREVVAAQARDHAAHSIRCSRSMLAKIMKPFVAIP